ncbi:hypothetical protein D3C85_1923500 [compost metagenome]
MIDQVSAPVPNCPADNSTVAPTSQVWIKGLTVRSLATTVTNAELKYPVPGWVAVTRARM